MKALKTTAIFSTLVTLAMLFACQPEINSNESGEEGIGGGEDNSVHVTGITLDRSSANILEGGSLTLVATVKPDNAENKNVSWSSSESAVASVDNNGNVTGIKAGSATVTAKTEDGGKTASCVITVEPNEAPSITLGADNISAISVVLKGKANLKSSASSDLKIGFQYSKSAGILPTNSITVDAEDADANYNYTTSLTGLEPGTTYYFRSLVRQNGQDEYGETKEFKTKDVESLIETLDASDVEVTKATLNAKLDLTDVKYENITYGFYWGTSESSQNTYLSGGDIANSAYATTMTDLSHKTQYWYKAYVKLDNQTFSGDVKTFTTDLIKVESVSLDKPEYSFNTIGNTLTLKATVLPADATNKSVEWVSSNADVATVDQTGKVSAVGNGTATITVTTKDQNKTATCAITVAQFVTSIHLDQTSLTLNEGGEYTFTVTVNPDNAVNKTLKWTSSDNSVATVDNNGKVTAVGKGSATIKAEAQDNSGMFTTCSVTVIRLVSSIELDFTTLDFLPGDSWSLVATIIPSDASNKDLDWSIDKSDVATIDNSLVKAIAKGKATITVSAKDGSGITASCSIVVSNPCPIEAVDLGLKNSEGYRLYWAKSNLSTSGLCANPEDYGDYYAWGETAPKDIYSWTTYKWCNGSYDSLTKYNFVSTYGTVDNKAVLDSEDDAAHVVLGGNWRIPTSNECKDLLNKCAKTWTSVNGVNGRQVTGPNGNSIFFPAAGGMIDYGLGSAGQSGYYWSSSLYSKKGLQERAVRLKLGSNGVGTYDCDRYFGNSIRPVSE